MTSETYKRDVIAIVRGETSREMLNRMRLDGYKGNSEDQIQSHPTTLLYDCSTISTNDVDYIKSLSDEWPFLYYLTNYNVVGFHRLLDEEENKWYYLISINQLLPDNNGRMNMNTENSLFASQIQKRTCKGSPSRLCYYMNNKG